MPRYIANSDLISYGIGSSSETTLLDSIIDGAETMFDNLIGSETGLISSSKTDIFKVQDQVRQMQPYDLGRIFYLQTIKPTTITSVNGVSPGTIDVDYTLEGQRLEFKNPVAYPQTFPFQYKIVYMSGYVNTAAIPKDIKQAIIYICAALYNRKNNEGISQFRQDLLSVTYDKGKGILDGILDDQSSTFVNATIKSYKFYTVIS